MAESAPVGPPVGDDAIERRRGAARRTALAIGLVAVAIYAAFLMSGFVGAL